MKKRKKKSPLAKLQKQAEDLWRQYIKDRDGWKCQVREYDSSIPTTHTDVMNADHCFSRGNKNLFLDPANGTCICSGCHSSKSFGDKGISLVIDDIVRKREGAKKFEDMKFVDLFKGECSGWKLIPWVEDQIKHLTQLTEELKGDS